MRWSRTPARAGARRGEPAGFGLAERAKQAAAVVAHTEQVVAGLELGVGQLINWVEERRGKRACPPSTALPLSRRIIAPARKEIAHIVGRIDNPSYRIGLRLRISRAGAILPFAHSAEARAVRGGYVFRDDARRSIHCQIVRLPKNLSASRAEAERSRLSLHGPF